MTKMQEGIYAFQTIIAIFWLNYRTLNNEKKKHLIQNMYYCRRRHRRRCHHSLQSKACAVK